MMKKGLILLLFIMAAQAGFAQLLKLEDAVNIALKNSLDIQLLKNNQSIADINNYIGVAGGLPTVTANASDQEQVTNVDQKLNTGTVIHRNAAVGNNFNSNVTAGMLLYNGSRVVATKKRLEELEAQSAQYVNAQVQNLMAAVMTNYFDVVRQQSYLKTLGQSLEVAQKRLDIVKTQQMVGMANNADLYQSQLDLNTIIQNRESQILAVQLSKTDLLTLLNLRPDSVIAIEDTILIDKSITLTDIINNIGKNAELMAADQQIRINELLVKETKAQRYPSLRANASYNFSRNQISAGNVLLNQQQGMQGGLTLGIPIYNGSIFKRQQRVAEVNVKNAALQRDILMRDFTGTAVRTFQAYNSTMQQLETQQQNLQLAQKLLDLTLLRYQLREATILEVRQAQESFENASYIMTNLSFTSKSSEIELRRLTNQISL
jgi:outer membrane protein